LKLELRVYKYRQKAVNFNSHLKTFHVEFRFEFYIKIKPIQYKVGILFWFLILEIDSSIFKSVQISSLFCRFVQKIKKTIILLPWLICVTWRGNASLRSVLRRNYEYFISWNNVWKIQARGCCMHACISSIFNIFGQNKCLLTLLPQGVFAFKSVLSKKLYSDFCSISSLFRHSFFQKFF
jgi:hypothetical protein